MKVTGGILKVKDLLCTKTDGGDETLEKVNQIRIYSGEKYEVRQEAEAGEVCAVTGLQENLSWTGTWGSSRDAATNFGTGADLSGVPAGGL